MAKKFFTLLFLTVLALPLSTGLFAQDPTKMAKEVEVGGNGRQAECGQKYPDRPQKRWWSRDDYRLRQLHHWVAQYHAAKR